MSYRFEWLFGPVFLGAVLLPLIVPSFALIALAIVALAAVAALAVLTGAVLAMPYLLVRSLRRRLAVRRQPTEGSVAMASGIARTGLATKQSGAAGLANTTTARRSR